MKKLSKEDADVIVFKVRSEGLDYAAQEGYLEELSGTKYEKWLHAFNKAYNDLESAIEEIAADHGIEEYEV